MHEGSFRVPLRRGQHAPGVTRGFVIQAIVFASLAAACRTTGESTSAPTDRTNEFIALRDRLDRLSRRIELFSEEHGSRASALELRAAQLEARQISVEQAAGGMADLRDEIAQVRVEIARLGAEEELDRMYRERLERLEFALEGKLIPANSARSIDEIWRGYVEQRGEIQRLGTQLGAARPKP